MKTRQMGRQGTLHQVLSNQQRALEDCLSFLRPGDEILLIDAGVNLLGTVGSIQPGLARKGFAVNLCALLVDVKAKGLEQAAESQNVKLLGDLEWLDHVHSCRRVLSWK